MPLPLIIVAALVVLVLLGKQSKAAGSSSATAGPPTGPSSPNGSWNPADVPTYLHPYAVAPIATGANLYGGNEADPRIAGGSWFDDRFGGRCTYDPHGGPSGQGATTCDKPIPCEVAGTCWQNITNPFKALGPPPPPPK